MTGVQTCALPIYVRLALSFSDVDVDAPNAEGYSSLMLSAMTTTPQQEQICALLLCAGADTHTRTVNMSMALHFAARSNTLPQVAVLLAAGGSAIVKNADSDSAQDLASNAAVCELLAFARSICCNRILRQHPG